MRLIFCLIGMLILSACNTVNSIRLLTANSDLEPIWHGDEQSADIETLSIGEQRFIETTINGQGPFRFLLDSGAGIPCLMDTDKVKQLKLERHYDIEIGGNGNEQDSPAFTTEIDSIQIGPIEYNGLTFCVIPIDKTGYYHRRDETLFDGVIGTVLFDYFPVQIDHHNNRVTIFKENFQPEGVETAINMEESWGKYVIDAELMLGKQKINDGGKTQAKTVELIVDSGSRNYIKLNRELLFELDKNAGRISAADWGLSGRNNHQRALVNQIDINGIKIENIRANFIHDDDDDEYTYILGNGVLNMFTVTFDMPNEKLYLKKQKDISLQSKFNLIGLQLRKTSSGLFVIRNIVPELNAANFDFKEGDLVESINGMSANKISLADWISMSSINQMMQVCRVRVDNEACYDIEPKVWY